MFLSSKKIKAGLIKQNKSQKYMWSPRWT